MNKLKTLRDLDKFKGYGLFSKGVSEDDLRQEAIKWIHRLEYLASFYEPLEDITVSNWIKYFFNLTEED